MIATMAIPGWHPTPLNKIANVHWATRSKLKAKDYDIIHAAVMAYGVPAAQAKRRVRLHLVIGKGQRACDPDAYWKSVLDALVHAGAIRNDSHVWCEITQPTFSRGEVMTTFVTVEDC